MQETVLLCTYFECIHSCIRLSLSFIHMNGCTAWRTICLSDSLYSYSSTFTHNISISCPSVPFFSGTVPLVSDFFFIERDADIPFCLVFHCPRPVLSWLWDTLKMLAWLSWREAAADLPNTTRFFIRKLVLSVSLLNLIYSKWTKRTVQQCTFMMYI